MGIPYELTAMKPLQFMGYRSGSGGLSQVDMQDLTISHDRSVKDDMYQADIVIYWGSTVALEALWMGKPLVHFKMNSILDCDPLFECQDLKWVVSEKDSLIEALEKIYMLPENEFKVQCQKAKMYLQHYFNPVNEESLKKFL